MENELETIGKNIRTHRLKARITQRELADKLGVTHFWICKLEKGKKNTTVKLLMSISEELNVDLNELTKR